jgi:Zn-dependent protease with chaperone function
MDDQLFARCACQACGAHIEFPLEAAGLSADCPHCQQSTLLTLEAPPADPTKLTATGILNAFGSGISPARTSFLYQIGLVLVMVVMLILPVIYVAIVTAMGWAVYYFAVHCSFLVTSMFGGPRLYLIKLFLYAMPLFIGSLMVFFMIKPLFARRRDQAQPLAVNPATEATLFAFIAKICGEVGAPMPTRIQLDCELNASAGFRRGVASMFGNDLVLRIGLPLVAGLNLQQFAGVIAHEFGHFTQGYGMRLCYVIRSINGWFVRVIYERDAWDVWLARWALESSDWRSMLVAGFAQFAVWISRSCLKLLMFFGHGVGCFLLRQMEYDADTYEIKLAGSDAFEQTAKRLKVLNEASSNSYHIIQTAWKVKKMLPDDFPAFLMQQDAKIPHDRRTFIEDTSGLSRTGIFHSHPSDGDRIRRARQAGEAGIFHLTQPAKLLFANFEAVSKQVTSIHYTDEIGLKFDHAALQPVAPT